MHTNTTYSLLFTFLMTFAAMATAQDELFFGPGNLLLDSDIFYTHEIIVSDLDADGDDDLVAYINQTSGGSTFAIGVLENTGSGEISMRLQIDLPDPNETYLNDLAIADMDGDGLQDIVIMTEIGQFAPPWGRMAIYRQISPMIFEFENETFLDNFTYYMEILDFDADGDNDVLAWGNQDWTLWLENDGLGTLELTDTLTGPFDYRNRDVYMDLNVDGYPDLIGSGDNDIQGLHFFENLAGSGEFAPPVMLMDVYHRVMAVQDLDGNGIDDLLIEFTSTNELLALYNFGVLPLQESDWRVAGNASTNSSTLALLDMNADMLEDLVLVNTFGLEYYLNNGAGFDELSRNAMESVLTLEFIAAAELNGDDRTDLVGTVSSMAVLLGHDSDTTFKEPDFFIADPFDPLIGAVDDIDLDGDKDLVISYVSRVLEFSDTVYYSEAAWLENQGDGGFDPEESLSVEYFNGVYGIGGPFILSDIDLDGDQDIVTTKLNGDFIFGTYPGIDILWNENLGQGNFANEHLVGRIVVGSEAAIFLDVADLDGDGDPDVVAHRTVTDIDNPFASLDVGLVWFENGTEGFSEPIYFRDGLEEGVIDAIDLDIDGDVDITHFGDEETIALLNDGEGNFTEENILLDAGGHDLFSTDWVDLNGDQLPDLTGALFTFFSIAPVVYYNVGLDTLWTADTLFINDFQLFPFLIFEFTDMDMDGDQDLISLNPTENWVYFSENQDSANFAEPVELLELEAPIQLEYFHYAFFRPYLHMADLNNDGSTDMVIGADQNSSIYWYPNLTGSDDLIRAQVFFDNNEDGIRNGADMGLENQNIQVSPEAIAQLTNSGGTAIFYGESGQTYNVELDVPDGWHQTSVPESYQVTLPLDTPEVLLFGIYPDEIIHDVRPFITATPTICNIPIPYHITMTNEGTLPEMGVLEFILHPGVGFASATPEESAVAGDTIHWTFDQLMPGESRNTVANLLFEDLGLIGDTLIFFANVYLTDTAGTVFDTFSRKYATIFLCSYDPNDKLVQPPGTGTSNQTLLDETLSYTIRFQNTGNFPATNVRITDIIDDDLDLSTFRVIHHSHTMITSIDQTAREVTFSFPNIMLPDSTSDPEGSNGFVTYIIQPLAGLEDNTVVQNTADIIFDFNPPITTNTVMNTLVETIGVQNPTTVIEVDGRSLTATLFPNPSSDFLSLRLNGDEMQLNFEILDVSGKQALKTSGGLSDHFTIPVHDLIPGVYLIKVIDAASGEFMGAFKFIKD